MFTFALSTQSLGAWERDNLREALKQSEFRNLEIQLRDLGPDENGRRNADFFRDLIHAGLLQAVSAHIPYSHDPSAPDESERREAVRFILELLRINADFLPRRLTLHGSREPVSDHLAERENRVKQLRRSLAELLACTGPAGQRIQLEFLPRSCIGNKESELLAATAGFPTDQLGILLDVNHVMTRFAELPAIVKRLSERLCACHLSDYDGVDERHWYIGQGVIPWPALAHALAEVPRDLLLIMENRVGCPIPAEFALRQARCDRYLFEHPDLIAEIHPGQAADSLY